MSDQQSLAATIGALLQTRQTFHDYMGAATEQLIDSSMNVNRAIHACPDKGVTARLDADLVTAMRTLFRASENTTIAITECLDTEIAQLENLRRADLP